MSAHTFPRMGQITLGNPNHYNGSGLMLRELRARAKDPDGAHAKAALDDLEAGFKEDEGVKLSERLAVQHNLCDIIGDLLSDLCPEGLEFDVRRWPDGNHNYGYYPPGKKREYL